MEGAGCFTVEAGQVEPGWQGQGQGGWQVTGTPRQGSGQGQEGWQVTGTACHHIPVTPPATPPATRQHISTPCMYTGLYHLLQAVHMPYWYTTMRYIQYL